MTFTTCFSYISVVHFSPIQSYSTHSGFIQFTLVLFGSLWFHSIHSVHFGSIRSTLVCLFFLVDIGLIRSIPSTSVLFNSFYPLRSTLVLFGPLWLYSVHSVHFGSIQSCSVCFGPIWSTLVLLGPFWSYSVHSVYFGLIRSIQSTLVLFFLFCLLLSNFVLFGPFGLLFSYMVHISLVRSILSTSINFSSIRYILPTLVLFSLLWPYTVHFGSIQSILVLYGSLWTNSVHFDSIQSILVLFGSHWSYSVHSFYFCQILSYSIHSVYFGFI